MAPALSRLLSLGLIAFGLWGSHAQAQVYCLREVGPEPEELQSFAFEGSLAPAPVCGDQTCSTGETCAQCPCDCCNPGFSISPGAGLVVSEDGTTAQFTVKLRTKPSGSVTLSLTSSDLTEGTVSPSSFTFSNGNWDNPQTAIVTGVDDALADGNITFSILTGPATSGDPDYNGYNPADINVRNNDNEAVFGFTVTPVSGLVTTEAGGSATFTLRLNSQPTASVSVALSSSDSTEGTVSPASLSFSTTNWNTAQTVTVTGVDDPVDDGNVAYSVVTAPATSGDTGYNALNPADVTVSNTDDDTAGITVTHSPGLTTSEAGGTATFALVLTTQPTAAVTVGLSSSDATEGTVPASVSFTTANWNVAQTVTITGVNDALDDGDVGFSIVTGAATSADPAYNGFNAADVPVTNLDDDSAGATVTPTSGLITTEAGGTATFTVVLTAQPSASVSIGVSSSDTTEGTVSPATLTFSTSSWSTPQTVTVTGANDSLDDGNVAFTVVTAAATSGDLAYSGFNPADVAVTNSDNDSSGVSVTPTSGLVTTEAGGTATFTVVLTAEPIAGVLLGLSTSDATEGTVAPTAIAFTTANWNTPQTITVTGVDDPATDGNVAYQVITAAAISSDINYDGLNPADVSVTNSDNDAAGFTLTPSGGLSTTEAGATATFTVALTAQPTANVSVALSSSDAGEATVSPASVTFTTANWSTPQTVTVTGVDDPLDDGDVALSVVTGAAVSGDPAYGGLNPPDVSVTNRDDDVSGFAIAPTAGLVTTEAGGTATFTVALTAQPTANVSVGLSSSDTTEGTVSPASLVFTASNWASAQTVTVTGVNDALDDGDLAFTVITSAATSTDPGYSGLAVLDVAATNTDDDSTGISVTPTSGLLTSEAGGAATFTVVLGSQPTAGVTIGLSSSDASEVTAPASVAFTPANWSVPQTVTLTGVDDAVDDGDVAVTVVTAVATSADATYGGMNAADVSVTNRDDDSVGVSVNPTSGLITTEAGGTASFTLVLASQPTAAVAFTLSSSDAAEGAISPTAVTFTAGDWNVPRQITLTGVDDLLTDGSAGYLALISPAVSADPAYDGMDPPDVAATNEDDDLAQIQVTPVSGLITSERGRTAQFTVVLTALPTGDVDLSVQVSAPSEATVSAGNLHFSPSDWDTAQTVTVTGLDDAAQDGDVAYQVVLPPAISADPRYDGRDPDDVSLLNLDDDRPLVLPVASFEVSPAQGTAPLAGAFDGRASTADPLTPLVLHRWSFKDGSPSAQGDQVNHSYPLPGGYLPELWVIDELGQEDRTARPVRVADAAGRVPPLARIVATGLAAEGSLTASFSCDCQPGDAAIVSYLWELGAETAVTPELTDRSFSAGRHPVRLTVVDANGLSSTDSTEVVVTQGGATPAFCDLTLSPASGPAPLEVEHRGVSADPATRTLTFSDGSTSGLEAVTRRYDAPGRYPVRLEVVDSQGLRCADQEEVVVVGAAGAIPPTVLGAPPPTATCAVPYVHVPVPSGTGPFSWSAVAMPGEELPEGLTVDPVSGRVDWMPSSAQTGTWQFLLQAQNAAGAGAQQLQIEVGCGAEQSLAVGCGCGSAPGGAVLFGLLALLAAIARRRAIPRTPPAFFPSVARSAKSRDGSPTQSGPPGAMRWKR